MIEAHSLANAVQPSVGGRLESHALTGARLRMVVLLVQHDPASASALGGALTAMGYEVRRAASAADTWETVSRGLPDLVLLDLRLPDTDGLLLCADLDARLRVPVIVWSATSRRSDPALAFRLGAADFISQATTPHELQARIEAALRRMPAPAPGSPPSASEPLQTGHLLLDARRREAHVGGQPLRLTRTEFDLLYGLAANAGRAVSRDEIARLLWGTRSDRNHRTTDVHVRRVRAKLASATKAGEAVPRIVSLHGLGYMLA